MTSPDKGIGELIRGMREAFRCGENMMAWYRRTTEQKQNDLNATLLAYDIQAGSYVQIAIDCPDAIGRWCKQLAEIIRPFMEEGDSVLEVGVGEATTLSGVIKELGIINLKALGFDLSWSRIKVGQRWALQQGLLADLFVADLFQIPLCDGAVDVVYTSHSIEPNGGREREALKELLRIARRTVVLFEPIYELGAEDAQSRMRQHGYVRNLKNIAIELGATVVRYELLDYSHNPLNPSGVIVLNVGKAGLRPNNIWRCPISCTELARAEDAFLAKKVGIAYPILRGIPMIRPEHAIVASRMIDECDIG